MSDADVILLLEQSVDLVGLAETLGTLADVAQAKAESIAGTENERCRLLLSVARKLRKLAGAQAFCRL